jgi:hypothetical protein
VNEKIRLEGLPHHTVQKTLRAAGLQPHRQETYLATTIPIFAPEGQKSYRVYLKLFQEPQSLVSMRRAPFKHWIQKSECVFLFFSRDTRVRLTSDVRNVTCSLPEDMPANLQLEPDGICVLRISGKLKRSEFGEAQEAIARTIDTGTEPRLLAILNEFEGWERGADWNDLDFLFSHSEKIAKDCDLG